MRDLIIVPKHAKLPIQSFNFTMHFTCFTYDICHPCTFHDVTFWCYKTLTVDLKGNMRH